MSFIGNLYKCDKVSSLTVSSTAQTAGTSSGSLIVSGGIGCADGIYSNTINCIATTQADSTLTGSIITTGGLAVAKHSRVGGTMYGGGNVDLSSSDTWQTRFELKNTSGGASNRSFDFILGGSANDYVGTNNFGFYSDQFGGVPFKIYGANGQLQLGSTLQSSNTLTGGLICAGGIGCADGIYSNTIKCVSTTQADNTFTGAIISSGGLSVAKNLCVGGGLLHRISQANYSTGLSSYNSALPDSYAHNFFQGGYNDQKYNEAQMWFTKVGDGNSKNSIDMQVSYQQKGLRVFADSSVAINGTIQATDTESGVLVVSGGASIAKDLRVGGTIYGTISGGGGSQASLTLTNTTESATTGQGTLIVAGGGGFAKSVYARDFMALDAGSQIVGDTIQSNTTLMVNGTGDSSSSSTGALYCAGGFGIKKKVYIGDGLYLPTSGGTASSLNYYEETTHDTTFTSGGTSATKTLLLKRIGKMVFCRIPNFTLTATGSSVMKTDTAIPSRFRVSNGIFCNSVIDWNNSTIQTGFAYLEGTGVLEILQPDAITNFSGTCGLPYITCVSWSLD